MAGWRQGFNATEVFTVFDDDSLHSKYGSEMLHELRPFLWLEISR